MTSSQTTTDTGLGDLFDASGTEPMPAPASVAGGPRLFTFEPGAPFLDSLARAVLSGALPGGTDDPGIAPPQRPTPDEIAALTIYLPTRRACRALQEAFLRASSGRALLLPSLRPIGDADEAEHIFTASAQTSFDGLGLTHPVIDPLSRQLLLARLIREWQIETAATSAEPAQSLSAGTPAQAIRLASALARFIDEVETEQVSLAGLAQLVPEDLSAHWQTTLSFLKILTERLPAELDRRGLSAPAGERNRALQQKAAAIRNAPETGGIIVAGVTGSVPATVGLMDAAAAHPRGAVVLPGIDLLLDQESFRAILKSAEATAYPELADTATHEHRPHPEHPQYVIAKLLDRLGARRADVMPLKPDREASSNRMALDRAALVSETMRPAATTDLWADLDQRMSPDAARQALQNVHRLTLPSAPDEAEAVALILRQTLETPGKTAALISPDRLLARRVVSRLASWGIEVDDSAGRPFRKTEVGTLVGLILETIRTRFSPITVTALLKHPLVRLGLTVGETRRRARNLEIAAFRTVYLGAGLTDIAIALNRARDDAEHDRRRGRAIKSLSDQNWDDAENLVVRFSEAFALWQEMIDRPATRPLQDYVRALIETAEALCLPAQQEGADPNATATAGATLWAGEGGEVASELFGRLLTPGPDAPVLNIDDVPDVIASLTADATVRPSTRAHPRLAIWGPFEARLMQPDVVILGSLNEGTWPSLPEPGPWINRPMRQALGLPQPEEALGRTAHDFSQFLAAETVYLTRAEKVDGKPTVSSRWLLRLDAVLAALKCTDAADCATPWVAWSSARQHIGERELIEAPQPRPPVELRPKRLSVTDVERWIANPYAIFASRILKLDPLSPIAPAPDAAERGAIVHEALNRFAAMYPSDLPPDPAAKLIALAEELMADYTAHANVAAFWRPRFERFAEWFAETESQRRTHIARVHSELSGQLALECARAELTLTARADRIDETSDGLAIYDYKGAQGIEDLARRAQSGKAPQLPLEAAIASAGGFRNLESGLAVAKLAYISTAGGEPPGAEAALKIDDIAATAGETLAQVAALADKFADPETPYRTTRREGFDYRYDDFAHLARVQEWSGNASENGGEE